MRRLRMTAALALLVLLAAAMFFTGGCDLGGT